MITAWRITKADYQKNAMDGEGAFRYGGRWNHQGTRMVYLAESKSLAAMEIMVHVDRSLLSVPYIIIPVKFDDGIFQDLNPLPEQWNDLVASASTMQAGDDWVESMASPLLRVPSIIVPGEWNYLLNPTHPEAGNIKIGAPEPFVFDSRFL